jgi:hypothetical protein
MPRERGLIQTGGYRVAALNRAPVDLGDDFSLGPAVALAVLPQAVHPAEPPSLSPVTLVTGDAKAGPQRRST